MECCGQLDSESVSTTVPYLLIYLKLWHPTPPSPVTQLCCLTLLSLTPLFYLFFVPQSIILTIHSPKYLESLNPTIYILNSPLFLESPHFYDNLCYYTCSSKNKSKSALPMVDFFGFYKIKVYFVRVSMCHSNFQQRRIRSLIKISEISYCLWNFIYLLGFNMRGSPHQSFS